MRPPAVDLAPLLDQQGWTRNKLMVVILAALAVVLDGFDVQAMSFAAPDLVDNWNIDRSTLGPIFALSFIGMAIGTFGGGWLGDRIGRRGAILASTALFAAMTVLLAAAPNIAVLGALRFVSSVGLGAMLPNAAALIAEYTPSRHRALAVALGLVCNPVGGALGGVAASFLLPTIGWRGLFLVAGVLPLLLAAILYFKLPESLRFLLQSPARRPQLEKTLRRFGVAVVPGQEIIDSAHVPVGTGSSLAALFAPSLRRDTIGLSLGFFGAMMGVYLIFAWMPLLLAGGGFDLSASSLGLALCNAASVLTTIAAGWLLARHGSIRIASLFVAAGLITSIGFSFIPLTTANETAMWTSMILIGATVVVTPACLFAMSAHAFPVQVRSTGVGFTAGMGRIGATIAALAGAPLVEMGSGAYLTAIAAMMGITLVGILIVRHHIPAVARCK